ncbi:MAG: hypothetical protein ABSA49_15040 [Rhizomicrobium sp.]|jgi:hypothetical protein
MKAKLFLGAATVIAIVSTQAMPANADCRAVSPGPGQTIAQNGSHYVFTPSADQLQGGYVAGGGCRFKDSSFSGAWPHAEGGAVTGWECEGNGVQGGSSSNIQLKDAGGLTGIWATVCRP